MKKKIVWFLQNCRRSLAPAALAAGSIMLSPALTHADGKIFPILGQRPWLNAAKPIGQRVSELLSRMTLRQKVGQLMQVYWGTQHLPALAPAIKSGDVSSFLGVPAPAHLTGAAFWKYRLLRENAAQRMAVSDTRLGIPLLFGEDVVHGCKTIFPVPLAMSCSWSPSMVQQCQTVAAREATAAGIDWVFAPMVNISHDPRWGRVAEGFGEDPYLDSLFTAAAVRGFQGTALGTRDHVISCLKHYIGYGSVQGGRDYNQAELTRFTLWNYHIPAFRAGINAGAATVMSAFNSIGGIPATADRYTLHHVLRTQLGFRGLVVSDWGGVGQLVNWGYARTPADAARRALFAGVDMEMFSHTYTTLARQVREGKVSIAEVNAAVRRVLAVKFASGLFEHPYFSMTRWRHAFLKPASLQLAFQAAERSCVLLKNSHNILPLLHPPRDIALIGPFVNTRSQFLGCWHDLGGVHHMTSLSQCLRKALGGNVTWSIVKTGMSGKGFRQAAAAARSADLVLLAVGETSSMTGENTSRKRIGLPKKEQKLFNMVAASGKPVVTLLFNGRPLTIPHVVRSSAAVLECWQLGTQTAPAVTAVLLGKYDPSGRLTMDFPRSIGQIPVFYDHLNTGRPTLGKYIDGTRKAEFPFGYGLSYTKFHIGSVHLNVIRSAGTKPVIASARVTNIGHVPGIATVELYIRGLYFSAGCRPVRELKGFRHVQLSPGQSRSVSFALGAQDWGYYTAGGRWLVEPSHFEIWISSNSISGQPADFTLARPSSPVRTGKRSVTTVATSLSYHGPLRHH